VYNPSFTNTHNEEYNMMTQEQFKHLRLRTALLARTIRESSAPEGHHLHITQAHHDTLAELQAQIAHEIELRKEEA
jgi:hypothetical protein